MDGMISGIDTFLPAFMGPLASHVEKQSRPVRQSFSTLANTT